MSIIKVFHLMSALDDQIYRKCTGTPTELAKRLDVTERSVYLYIEELKRVGAPIAYDSELRSYVYTEPFRFVTIIRRECQASALLETNVNKK